MPPSTQELRTSSTFLNAVLDSMNAAVMLLDGEFRLHEVNDALRRLFHAASDTRGLSCGEALHCGNLAREGGTCGSTSACAQCVIRKAVLRALREGDDSRGVTLTRDFHGVGADSRGSTVLHLQLSVTPLDFDGERMALAVLHDVTQIEVAKRLLEEKEARLRDDLKAAAVIQSSLLPPCCPEIPGLSFAWKFAPCEVVGGDYFNVFELPGGIVGIVQIDVCGHGVSAAMLAVSLSRMLAPDTGVLVDRGGRQPRTLLPDAVLVRLDELYPFHRFETFFTALYMQVDVREGLMTYSSGGHPPAWLIRRGQKPVPLVVPGRVVGLGSMCEAGDGCSIPAFPLVTNSLEPGDKVLLATDGLTEHRAPGGEFFGTERLETLLERHADLPIASLVERIYDEAITWGGGQSPADDISLLGFERCPGACAIS